MGAPTDTVHEEAVALYEQVRRVVGQEEKGEPVRLDILSVEISGNTASAKVRDDYLGMTFLDTLSLLKVEDEWTIYNKLFHVEGSSG